MRQGVGETEGREIARRRCHHHPSREAVARCPRCRRYYCRECVAEHSGEILCADCLKKLTTAPRRKRKPLGGLVRTAQIIIGVALLWSCFLIVSRALLNIPGVFHEGTVWEMTWGDRR